MSLSWLNPLNWYHDITSTFLSELEHGLEYLYSLVMQAILTATSSIFGIITTALNDVLEALVDLAIFLGPLALPVFAIVVALVIGIAYIAFGFVKDMPVVGAFA